MQGYVAIERIESSFKRCAVRGAQRIGGLGSVTHCVMDPSACRVNGLEWEMGIKCAE